MNGADVLERLKAGNERFVADKLDGKLQDSVRRSSLTGGQEPYAIILSCADSRVVPELAFDAGLGELFVVRVAGNVANTSSIGSIEYAVAYIKCPLLIVLGHENCGAVTAAMQGGNNGYNINHLLAHITPAIAEADSMASVNDVVRSNVRATAQELQLRSTVIRDAIHNGELMIARGFYNLGSGCVDFFDDRVA